MTIDWISFALGGLVGVWAGAMAGIIIAALCHAAADADREDDNNVIWYRAHCDSRHTGEDAGARNVQNRG